MKLGFVLLLSLSAFGEPVRMDKAGWKMWSHREATAPKVSIDHTVTRSGQGALVVSGNSNLAVHGGWEYTIGEVTPNRWYRFTAYYKTQGVLHPTWQVLPRLDWRNAAGKRTGQPDFVYQARQEGDWTKTWIEVPAPETASAVVLQLYLSNAPAGTIWWDDVSFEEVAAPKERKIKVATIKLRPRGLKSREENVEAFVKAANEAAPGNLDMLLFPEGIDRKSVV